jgi:hypothetical protein
LNVVATLNNPLYQTAISEVHPDCQWTYSRIIGN